MEIEGAIIEGQALSGSGPINVLNPATNEIIGQVKGCDSRIVEQALNSAKRAFPSWSTQPLAERRKALLACADILDSHAEELAKLLTLEQGKPLNGMGARFEIGGAAAWTRHTATLHLPIELVQDDADAHVAIHRKALGVVASITPWNWPVMIAVWHIMPALLAGNVVVIKPSPFTPLATLRMVELFQTALPKGVLNAVVGTDEIGPILTSHPAVAKVCFTGSTRTGRAVMSSAAPTLKRLTLELGGNDAGIVLPDCNPAAIAEGLFWGALINTGQTCAALKRLYVHDSIYDAVCQELVNFAQSVKLGDGSDEASLLGPLQNRMQFDRVTGLVDRARQDGARILCGGTPLDSPGNFYPATFVADAEAGMPLVDEEQFGPALPILRYSSLDDALEQSNALDFGLGGSIWSADVARARDLAMQLECGTAWVNKHGAIRPDVPFGGVKSSGFGVEFGQHGLDEFVSLHVIHD